MDYKLKLPKGLVEAIKERRIPQRDLVKLVSEFVAQRTPKETPRFLGGDSGKAVLEEFKGRVKADYEDNSVLNVLTYEDGVVKGSNPFAVVLVNQIIRGQGLRTATQADLERILRKNALDLRGAYEDSALVLRTDGDSYERNDYLAKDLAKQLKARGKAEMPAMIALKDLDLVKEGSSHYRLAFKLRDDAEIVHAPILFKGGNFSSEDVDERTGLPMRVGSGNRFLYGKADGLSRLSLYRFLIANSSWYDLDYSYSYGRVVVVSGSAAGLKKSK